MPKVFGLHEVVLPAGMTAEEYERFGTELASLPDLQGWKTYLSNVIAETEPESSY
jgi:hypothetical protein